MSGYGNPSIANVDDISPYKRWQVEINYAEKELEKFRKRARKVNRRFVDERDAMDSAQRWFNLFHTNTKIMRAALYAQVPQPEVKRKFLDYQDQIARVAANILQRVVSPDKDDPRDTFDACIRNVVMDRLIGGLGQVWFRLETDTEDVELQLESTYDAGEDQVGAQDHHNYPVNSGFAAGPVPGEMTPPQSGGQDPAAPVQQPVVYQRITDQRVVMDYVYWADFVWSPCRVWEERRWVGRRVYMTRPELVKRFGAKIGGEVPLNYRPRPMGLDGGGNSLTPENQAIEMAEVYEIWDRMERAVVWYCKDYPQLLDSKPDFLQLVGFEPCPTPLLANVTTSNTVPRPDFYIVQDQYTELDTINARISLLLQALRVAGVYDQSAAGVQRLLSEGTDNTLIPVDNWALFAEKGGIKGQIDWLPIDQIASVLGQLNDAREVTKQQIYELTGISDIVRGTSRPSETLGAQQLKAQFASVRIKDLQDDIARFVSECLRIKGELLVKHFAPDIIIRKSNIMRTDDAMLAQQAMMLLQSEEGFEWRITVTADQLAQMDYASQKQDRTELLTAVGQYISQIKDVIAAAPELSALFVTLLKWAVSGFKGARDVEGYIDQQLDTMLKRQQQAAMKPQPPQPSPAQQQIQMDMQLKAQEGDMRKQMAVIDIQAQQAKHAQDLQFQKQKNQIDLLKNLADMQLKQQQQAQSGVM